MTESVWWYVLAGFLIGFVLSTLWEWLYFRRRRLRTENRRIAELEATVRSLTLAGGSVGHPAATVTPVAPPEYQGPGVFLENEGAPGMPEAGLAPQPAFAVYGATDKPPQPDAQPEQVPPPTVIKRTRSQYVERTAPVAGEPIKTAEQTPPPPTVIERTSSQYVERTAPAAGEPVETAEQTPPPPTVIERTSSQYVERTAPVAGEPVETAEQTPPPPTVIERTSSQYVERTAPAAGEPVKAAEQEQLPPQSEPPVAPEPAHAQKAAPIPVVAGALAALSHLSKAPASDPQPQSDPAPAQPAPAQPAPAQPAPAQPAPAQPAPAQPAPAQPAPAQPAPAQPAPVAPQPDPTAAPPTPLVRPIPAQQNGFAHKGQEGAIDKASTEADAREPVSAEPRNAQDAAPGGQAEQLPAAPPLLSFLPAAPKLADAAGNGSHPDAALTGKALPAEGLGPGIQRVSSELEDALASLQGLIQTTDPLLDSTAVDEASHPDTAEPAVTGPYEARNLSRGEYTVVRFMQSARQFGRELRALYWRG